ncbi:hypothetical protein [Streptosporangium sp. NPDC087985]
MAETDALLEALSRRENVPASDAAVRLLSALIDDVDQGCSPVSSTPST